MIFQDSFTVNTTGRGSYDITANVESAVQNKNIDIGLCHVFIHHTSASLILCENADPTVRSDLDRFMRRLVPDGDSILQHIDEGPDDMPAHIRTILTQTDLNIPIKNSRCMLGTWQGIFLWEHRLHGHSRKVTVTMLTN